jgi:hypothetical protein
MTRHNRSLTMRGAIFAIVLSCFTGSLFAQSTDQSSDQETQATDNATPRTTINWADFDTFDTGYESSVAIHPSGLIVEAHSSAQTIFTYTGLYYRHNHPRGHLSSIESVPCDALRVLIYEVRDRGEGCESNGLLCGTTWMVCSGPYRSEVAFRLRSTRVADPSNGGTDLEWTKTLALPVRKVKWT